jgi:hypothetical protein
MSSFLPWHLRAKLWWHFLMMGLWCMERSPRGAWIWVGHVGISFRIIPRFTSKLMIKNSAKKGIRVSQFGPLVATWEEAR